MRWLGEALAYALFAVVVGAFSAWPSYRLIGTQQAIVSLTFSHAGQRISPCHILTQAELDALPPNMRKPADCPRGRHPLMLELMSNGELLYRGEIRPSGLWEDGKANVYERIVIPAGRHEIRARMNDSGSDGFDVERSVTLDVTPGRNVVVRLADGKFQIR